MKFVIKQQLESNLSGKQITTLLDRFIIGALRPLWQHTTFVKRIFADILVQTYTDNRRKISVIDKKTLIDSLYTSVVTTNAKSSWSSVKKSSIERLILIRIFDSFLSITKDYLYYESEYLKSKSKEYDRRMKRIENIIGSDRKHLSSIIRNATCNTNFYYQFKQMIVEKYIKLAYSESCKTYNNSNNIQIDKEELFKNLIIAIDRAIDKYSPEKGALSSYIQWWFKDAKINPEFSHEYGQTMQVSGGTRRNIADKHGKGEYHLNTFNLNIDDHTELESDENIEKDLIDYQENENLVKSIQRIKSCNIAKLYLNIPYVLSEEEKKILRGN